MKPAKNAVTLRFPLRISRAGPLAVSIALLVPLFSASAQDCGPPTLGLTPLNDLGTRTHHGEQGGLYPGGSNVRPPAHTARGVALAATAAVPRAPTGAVDHRNGRLVFLAIGMSNAMQEFEAFRLLAARDPARRPHVVPVNGAVSGVDVDIASDSDAVYWDLVDRRLAGAGVTAEQVGVVWLKQTRKFPRLAFPADARYLEDHLATMVRILRVRFPNLALVYLSSRTYGGYALNELSPEPNAYHTGFAVKWLIERQLRGELPAGKETPWLSWGPYLWADGIEPRSDGLTWSCRDFHHDGIHPGPRAERKVASMLLNFLHADETARVWYEGRAPLSLRGR